MPVVIQIEPYFELNISGYTFEVDPKGKIVSSRDLKNDNLFFGQLKQKLVPHKKQDTPPRVFSTSHFSTMRASVANNFSPFKIEVEIVLNDVSLHLITDIKQAKNKDLSALQIRTRLAPDTQYRDHIEGLDEWRAFGVPPRLLVYNSKGNIVSDYVLVDFALKDVMKLIPAGSYGGSVFWTLIPEM